MKLETIKVKGGPKGTKLINARDYDPKVHERVDGGGDRPSVREVKAALPGLGDAELAELAEGDDRASVQKAVAAEQSRRAGA